MLKSLMENVLVFHFFKYLIENLLASSTVVLLDKKKLEEDLICIFYKKKGKYKKCSES